MGGSGAKRPHTASPPRPTLLLQCDGCSLQEGRDMLHRHVSTGTGSYRQGVVPVPGRIMSLFFKLHLDLQMAIFDMLDFGDR